MRKSPTPRGPKRHRIEVTRRDIRDGLVGCENCAIAIAIKRKWPASHPFVHYEYVRFGPVIVELPRSAQRFMARQETRPPARRLKPFTFFVTFRDLLP